MGSNVNIYIRMEEGGSWEPCSSEQISHQNWQQLVSFQLHISIIEIDDLLQRCLNLMKILVLRVTECTAILILIIMYTRGQPVLSVIAVIGVCIDKKRLVMDSCLLLCRKSKYSTLRWLEVVISSLSQWVWPNHWS